MFAPKLTNSDWREIQRAVSAVCAGRRVTMNALTDSSPKGVRGWRRVRAAKQAYRRARRLLAKLADTSKWRHWTADHR